MEEQVFALQTHICELVSVSVEHGGRRVKVWFACRI